MISPPSPREFNEKENLVRIPVDATYHSKFRAPACAHATRESADFAIDCLASADPADHAVGLRILERLLPLQVTDPTDPHYGIWGWYAEEPPHEMAPADWNWADFIGVRLLEIIHDYPQRLTPDLEQAIRTAVGHAARSIFRRNVGPGYTNICVMGAVACLAAGEILPDRNLLDYGQRRLRNLRRDFEFHGGYSEYNSPTYTLVVIEELERLLHLVQHPEAREDAEALLHATWQLLAGQFHPGTAQWAGPQSRTYHDWLSPEKARYIEARVGHRISIRSSTETHGAGEFASMRYPYPCPKSLRARFAELPSSPLELRHCWMKNQDGTPARVSTTWFTPDATLGTMNRDSTWVQRRALLGYWRTPEDSAVRIRARILHNGHDFAAGFIWNHQDENRVLCGIHFITGEGDFHPGLDFPADNIFRTRDLRVRFEIEGAGGIAEKLVPDLFELSAGPYKLTVHTGTIRFDGQSTAGWKCGTEKQIAFVEGEFYAGAERPFHPGKIGECTAAVGIELLPRDQTSSPHAVQEIEKDGYRIFRWPAVQDFEVRVPQAGGKRPIP